VAALVDEFDETRALSPAIACRDATPFVVPVVNRLIRSQKMRRYNLHGADRQIARVDFRPVVPPCNRLGSSPGL
jgi:hypothetical protein